MNFATYRGVFIGVVLVIFIILGWLFVNSGKVWAPGFLSKPSQLVINGVSVDAPLTKASVTAAIAFLHMALASVNYPKNLNFGFAEKGNQIKGDAYISRITAGAFNGSFLIGLDQKNKDAAYLRIWTTLPQQKRTEKELIKLPGSIFDAAFLSQIGELTCQRRENPVTKARPWVCTKLITTKDQSLLGITVRDEVTLTPPAGATPPPGADASPTVTIVSACMVSRGSAPLYSDNTCV